VRFGLLSPKNKIVRYRLIHFSFLFGAGILKVWVPEIVVKELSFAIIKQAFGRFEEQWRYKKRKNEL